jgi:Endomembrane protein 70
MPFCQTHSQEQGGDDDNTAEENTAEDRRGLVQVQREGAIKHKQRLGESIVGDRRETSPYDISFLDPVDWRMLCKVTLQPADLKKFKDAIHNNYFFEMFVEDLPMWGYLGDFADEDLIIGEVSGSKTVLFPHLHFYFGYNQDQIVTAKVTTDVRCRA